GSNGDRIACLLEPLAIASHLVDPHRELEPKGGGLGVHTVRASDTKGVAELNGLPLEDRRKAVNSFEQKVRGVAQLEAGGRIPDIRAGQAVMDITALFTQRFRDRAKERRYVVVRNGDVFIDLVDIERCVPPDLRGRLPRDLAELGPCLTGGHFDIEPPLKFVLLTPNGKHFGP